MRWSYHGLKFVEFLHSLHRSDQQCQKYTCTFSIWIRPIRNRAMLIFPDSLNLEYRLILLHGIYVHITASFTSLCNTPIWSEEIKGLTRCKKHLPAPMKEPFATIWFPWLFSVTPTFKRVPPKAVYMVAIWRTVALRAARSDCKCHSVQIQAQEKKSEFLVLLHATHLPQSWEDARYQ